MNLYRRIYSSLAVIFIVCCSFFVTNNNYQTEVLHFGASYKAVEYEWDQWIAQFEQLLSQMYWVSATVHLETELSGTHTFTWEAGGNCHVPGSGEFNVKCEWSHEGALSI